MVQQANKPSAIASTGVGRYPAHAAATFGNRPKRTANKIWEVAQSLLQQSGVHPHMRARERKLPQQGSHWPVVHHTLRVQRDRGQHRVQRPLLENILSQFASVRRQRSEYPPCYPVQGGVVLFSALLRPKLKWIHANSFTLLLVLGSSHEQVPPHLFGGCSQWVLRHRHCHALPGPAKDRGSCYHHLTTNTLVPQCTPEVCCTGLLRRRS